VQGGGEVNIKVNEKTWTVASTPDTPLLYVLSNEFAAAGAEVRMWPRAVRIVLGAGERR
jgi:hypothetical protein